MDDAMDPRKTVQLYTIYENPDDYPGKFVVRQWAATYPEPTPYKEPLGIVETLVEARELVPLGLARLMPTVNDDPKIVEVWL